MPIEGKIEGTFRKTSQRNWYSKWERLDPRGKSSKEKTLMIKELISQRNTLLSHINTLKYVIQKQKETYQYKATLKQGKIRRRNARLEDVKDELKDSERELRKREREVERLIAKLDNKSGTISELQKELNKEGSFNYLVKQQDEWKGKYDNLYLRYRRLLTRKRYKPVKKVIVEKQELTDREKRIKRISDSGAEYKDISITRMVENTFIFCEQYEVSPDVLRAVIRASVLPKISRKELKLSDMKIARSEESNFIASSYVGQAAGNGKKYWYITPVGKEMVQEYFKFLSKNKPDIL